jgi:hypothetical protein
MANKSNTWEEVVMSACMNMAEVGYLSFSVTDLINNQGGYMQNRRGTWPKSPASAITTALKKLKEKGRLGMSSVPKSYALPQNSVATPSPISQPSYSQPTYSPPTNFVPNTNVSAQSSSGLTIQQRSIIEEMIQTKRREVTRLQDEIAALDVCLRTQTNVNTNVVVPQVRPNLPLPANSIAPSLAVPTIPKPNIPPTISRPISRPIVPPTIPRVNTTISLNPIVPEDSSVPVSAPMVPTIPVSTPMVPTIGIVPVNNGLSLAPVDNNEEDDSDDDNNEDEQESENDEE